MAILRDGARRVIVPADALWDDFFTSPGVDLGERDQPEAPVRGLVVVTGNLGEFSRVDGLRAEDWVADS